MRSEERNKERFMATKSGRAFAGLILIVIGAALLARELGALIPEWIFTWQILVIALGFFFGARRNFQPGGWMIMILVGSIFIIDDFYPDLTFKNYVWPIVIIFFGLWMIMKPRRNRGEWGMSESAVDENAIEINAVFGGTKKKIMSKEFKGGEINSVFGGNDIDFTQADFSGTATLSISMVFGGAKLIVPPHWKIQSDVDCVFASVEDKRRDTSEISDKTLVIKGSVVFGSIEIKSY
jgi:predicted membrane protein